MLRDEKYYIDLNSRILNQFEKRGGYNTAGLYVQKLSEEGFIATAFDASFQGKLELSQGIWKTPQPE
jgi:hypothetical protein